MKKAASLSDRVRFWADISFRMLRLRTVMVMLTFEAIGYETVRATGKISLDFVLVATMLATLYMSATCFNDVADEEVDKVNLANDHSRPLMTTSATPAQLKRLGVCAIVTAFVAAALASPGQVLFVVIGVMLSVFYSLPPLKLSHRGILASLWLPLSYVGLSFFAGAFAAGMPNKLSYQVAVTMYVCFVGRILLKDFRDYEGDKKFGKRNFLVRHGPQKTCLAAAVAWLIGDALFAVMFERKYVVLTILMQPIILGILYTLKVLATEKSRPRLLLEVLFIGRLGNAVAVGLLAALTLEAYDYSGVIKNGITAAVVIFISLSAVGLLKDEALRSELGGK